MIRRPECAAGRRHSRNNGPRLVNLDRQRFGWLAIAGDIDKATQSLATLQKYTDRIHGGLSGDTKKLKDAEILMRHTAMRLTELLHNTSTEDQPHVVEALKHFEKVRGELMLAIFSH